MKLIVENRLVPILGAFRESMNEIIVYICIKNQGTFLFLKTLSKTQEQMLSCEV